MLDMGWIQKPLDDLYGRYAGLFVAENEAVLWALAGILLIMYAFRYGKSGGALWFFIDYGLPVLIAANILAWWTIPTPLLGGYSVSGFFPGVGEYYAGVIGSKEFDILLRQTSAIVAAINSPANATTDPAMLPIIWGVQLLMWALQAITFFSVAISYAMIGILRLLGPFFVPWLIFPRTSMYFWNMLQSLMQYSFFRIVAQALVFVIGTSVSLFIADVLHGDYSLAHLAVSMGKLVVITALSVMLVFRSERITADLFSGTASAGAGIADSVASKAAKAMTPAAMVA